MVGGRRILVAASVAALSGVGVLGAAQVSGAASTDPITFAYTGGSQAYTVPTDGSICAVTVDVAGANGGQSAVANEEGGPGTGGTAAATFPVTPGEVVTVDVGGVGGD